ncbi:MAG TPA: radical SAM protein [Dissulfurispiraceae bacterium]|nr:radical SAM protein [Dissulfurispiraceae bacterium]
MNRRLVERVDRLLSLEKGTVIKDPGGKIDLCLVYPNTYHVGMSNLGFQGIYGLLNKRSDVVCERAFLPGEGEREEYRRTGTPVFSYETKRPLSSFSVVAFSLSFENDYAHVATILDMAKVPLFAAERGDYDPLLIAGGVCVSANPEPVAPFFDFIFIGEAEESLNEFLDLYGGAAGLGAGRSSGRERLKDAVLRLTGVYVPGRYKVAPGRSGMVTERIPLGEAPPRIRWRRVDDISRDALSTTIITPETEFSSMHLVEVMRGCPWDCRFCLVGHVYGVPRKKNSGTLSREITDARGRASRIGLVGPSLTDYPHLEDILCIDGVNFSITSLRASARSARLVEFLKGSRTVSIAPEAGTERLRRVVSKRIDEDDILTTSRMLFDAGVETLRLYFMVGLPTETDGDILGIVSLVQKIRACSQRGAVVMSVSTFVPKPFTPFQWHPMVRLEEAREKLRILKDRLRKVRGVKLFHDVPKYAHMQGLFSLGDRRVAEVIRELPFRDSWVGACRKAGVDYEQYLFRPRDLDETLPWDFIDAGVPKERLWKEYNDSLSVSVSPEDSA